MRAKSKRLYEMLKGEGYEVDKEFGSKAPLEGKEVRVKIKRTCRKKGYSKERAEKIAGAVAGEEHEEKIGKRKMTKKAKRGRKYKELKKSLVRKHGKYVKGSPEAKAAMAKLREIRLGKK